MTFNNLIQMIVKICEIVLFTRATPGSSLVYDIKYYIPYSLEFQTYWLVMQVALSFLALLTNVRWAILRNVRDPTEALPTKDFDEKLEISSLSDPSLCTQYVTLR